MRFSEAVRLGAALRPQVFVAHWLDGKTCALGAALEAVGVLSQEIYDAFVALPEHERHAIVVDWKGLGWEALIVEDANRSHSCPACGITRFVPVSLVMHLNDSHQWTREQIADWYAETFEQVPATVVQHDEAATVAGEPVCAVRAEPSQDVPLVPELSTA